jgi:hypothetical protein
MIIGERGDNRIRANLSSIQHHKKNLTPLQGTGVLVYRVFMFSNFYCLNLHHKIHVALANLQWNICINRIENWISLNLVMVIKKRMFVDFLIGYIGPPNCVHKSSVE